MRSFLAESHFQAGLHLGKAVLPALPKVGAAGLTSYPFDGRIKPGRRVALRWIANSKRKIQHLGIVAKRFRSFVFAATLGDPSP